MGAKKVREEVRPVKVSVATNYPMNVAPKLLYLNLVSFLYPMHLHSTQK